MKLTGKCLDAFGEKCKYNYEEFMELPESCQNALIIEFFDSVGIKIFQYPLINCDDFDSVILYENMYIAMNVRLSRTEATNEAIIKANDLYNGNN